MKIISQFKKMMPLVMCIVFFAAASTRCFGEDVNKQLFDLKVALVLNAPKTTLAFTIKNDSKTALEIIGPGINSTPILIVTPSGKVVEYLVNVDPAILPQLKPSESKTWKMDNLLQVFKLDELNEPGIYRISWRLKHWVSDDKCVVYDSNEVLLLKE